MNYYSLLPLSAFLANMILGFYILYRSPKEKLNKLYSLFAFSLAIWALGTFLSSTSSTSEAAMSWNKLTVVGSLVMPAVLLHFFLVFTKKEDALRKIFYFPLYLPALFFITADFATNLIYESAELVYWGYSYVAGTLYTLVAVYILGYFIIGILFCYRFYSKTSVVKEKTQAKLLIIAILIPLVGGVITEVIPKIVGFEVLPLSTLFITISSVIVAYAIIKYGLLAPISFSIRKKLVAGFLIVSLLSGVVGYLSVSIAQEELQKEIGESSALLAQQIIDKIDRDIYGRIEEFQVYSADLILQETLIKSNQEFENLSNVQDYINETDLNWTSAPKETITPFMQELINNTLSEELSEKIEFYEEKYGYPVFGEIFVTNKYGANAALTGKTSDYRQDDESWWLNAENDSLYVEDVEYDRSAAVYSTDICLRIDDKEGNFLGVMKVVLNIEEIINILKGVEEEETLGFKLLTKEGGVIYATEEYELFEDISDELLSHFQEGGHIHYFIAPGDKPEDGEELFAHAHSKGYKDFKGLGWILIIEYETEEIFAPIIYMRNLIIVITFAIVLVSVLFGIIFSQSLSKPIIKLKNVASKMGKGNLDVKIDIKSNDEVGELATSFSEMAKSLKEQQDNLENLVAERTKELETKVDELQRFKKVTVGRELKMIELKKRIKDLEGNVKK